jgi:hypothetical protein
MEREDTDDSCRLLLLGAGATVKAEQLQLQLQLLLNRRERASRDFIILLLSCMLQYGFSSI